MPNRNPPNPTPPQPAHARGAPLRDMVPARANPRNPTPGAPDREHINLEKPKKANIIIGSLNMNGYTARGLTHFEKWSLVNQTLNKYKIAILALQEMHLDQERMETLRTAYGKKMEIIFSPDPNNPRATAGVAYVINKSLIKPRKTTTHELHAGRALSLQVEWLDTEVTTILNIYAPNERAAQPDFWAGIDRERREQNIPVPNFTLGDFNVTEEAIDRLPPRLDDMNAIEALRDTRLDWGCTDAWRAANPNEREFTYRAETVNGQIKARLDRIYMSEQTTPLVYDWVTTPSPVPTDHWLIAVKYAPKEAPQIGKGRWTLPIHLLRNEKFLRETTTEGQKLQQRLEWLQQAEPDRATDNPQRAWADFKIKIRDAAKAAMKKDRYKIDSRIKALKKDLDSLNNAPQATTDNSIRLHETAIEKEIKHLERKQARQLKDNLSAALTHHGENLGGIWSALNKEKKPRDYMRRLKIPNTQPPQYERDTRRMANLAKTYHENLQKADLHQTHNEDFEMRANLILEEIPPNQTLDDPFASPLNWCLTEAHTGKALKLAKNGSATGMDGCPYELWKILKERHKIETRKDKPSFDIVKTLTSLFRDIQIHGVDDSTNFALGWMCPIYKKKDPTDISNYRPITLLNSDYKLLTKVLAVQLMDHIEDLVHRNQAGFIPRRSIHNQIKLAKAMIAYTELAEEEGAIVALDQEKAYDKIRHDYLWKTMEAFNLPQPFIRTTQELYKNASTVVAINGIFSAPFQVTRGIRQGDPISCPLFDLAIEPLACMVRNDQHIHRIATPNLGEPIKINLFADDTNLYLNREDRLDYVQEALLDWCRVSGAKFNLEKTEIIPIGSVEHRQRVARTRKINQNDTNPLDDRVKIAHDGDAVRSLGAWIGNNVNDITPWEANLEGIHKELKIWRKGFPTMKGRKTIIQAMVGGRTQFLATAQGMPPHIEDALTKIIRDFIWEDDSEPRVALEILQQPTEHGGLNLLDIKARNEAIDIMWLKNYLQLTPERPEWALITDLIIDAAAPAGTCKKARMNAFLQTWDAPTRGPRASLIGYETIRMIKTAKKYNTDLSAIRIAPNLRNKLPAWYHLASVPKPITNVTSICLLNNHDVSTVADLLRASARIRNPPQTPEHQQDLLCICRDCVRDRLGGCRHPHACAQEAQTRLELIAPKLSPLQIENHGNFSLTERRKTRNEAARANQGEIIFNPTITCKGEIADCFRIFTDPNRKTNIPAERLQGRGAAQRHQEIEVYTDGACINNGKENACCGSGIWIAPDHLWNRAIRVPGTTQSNQMGELVAVIEAVKLIPPSWPLKILTDSKYVIDGLTVHLGKWEDQGWIGISNAKPFKMAAYLLKRRTATTTFKWVKGHDGIQGNEESDRLAKAGADKEIPDDLDLEVPKEYDLQGAKLSALTQALAYRGIQERKEIRTRQTTEDNLKIARKAVANYTGTRETDASLWRSTQNPSIRIKIRQYLYKAMNGTQKVGDFWRKVLYNVDRHLCTTCHTTESMGHILTTCQTPARRIIWQMARQFWPHNEIRWPEINIGVILGCGALTAQAQNPPQPRNEDPHNQTDHKGATRLLQILISESAHTIWAIRCERVIQDKLFEDNAIRTRWLKAINKRLIEDKIIATKIKRTGKAIQEMRETWEKVLRLDGDLPFRWEYDNEVLVGRRLPRV